MCFLGSERVGGMVICSRKQKTGNIFSALRAASKVALAVPKAECRVGSVGGIVGFLFVISLPVCCFAFCIEFEGI